MPALIYRLAFGAFGVRHIEASILLAGFATVPRWLIGGVGDLSAEHAQELLAKIEVMGSQAG